MAIHDYADSDMSIVYFSLMVNNENKIIKAEKKLNYWRDWQIPTNGTLCYTKHCRIFFDRPNVFSELFYFPDPSVMLWYIYESVMIS